jgi:hypothetical protein
MLVVLLFAIILGRGAGVSTGAAFLLMVVMGVIYFFPIYYLYQFSSYSKRAGDGSDSGLLTTAFMYLKKHYRYMGILFIVVIGVYIMIILVALLSGSHILKYF